MKKPFRLNQLPFLCIVAILILSSCGTQNLLTKAKKSGVLLEYNFSDKTLNYNQTQVIEQELDAMGQMVNIDINSEINFSTSKSADVGENAKLQMKINSMNMSID
ncbi:MAG: hypothetical protein HQ541_18215, partial [Mariniphaga sp.]|nr:hypothetical protein [Mariniphaga sp.]